MKEIKEKIISTLRARGWEVTEKEVVKNSVVKAGIEVRKDRQANIGATFYIDEYIKAGSADGHTPEEIFDRIMKSIDESLAKQPTLDVASFFNLENVRNTLRVGVQKFSSESELVKRPTQYKGIEEYAYLKVNSSSIGNGRIKLTDKHLSYLGLTADEVFEIGRRNNHEDVSIIPLFEYMDIPVFGMDYPYPPVYVVTNKARYYGAATLLDNMAITEISEKTGVFKWFAIPSSIHEIILLPVQDTVPIEILKEMVEEVNRTVVLPEDVLADEAFEIIVDEKFMNAV